jgi:hypothetical protein
LWLMAPQPANAVSSGHLRILGKHPRLPPLTGAVIGLRGRKITLA